MSSNKKSSLNDEIVVSAASAFNQNHRVQVRQNHRTISSPLVNPLIYKDIESLNGQ